LAIGFTIPSPKRLVRGSVTDANLAMTLELPSLSKLLAPGIYFKVDRTNLALAKIAAPEG